MSTTLAFPSSLDSAVSKIFRRVVPLLIIMLICNQLNRSNIGYAQKYLEADVGIGAAAYGFGAGVFFIAYAIFELPSNMMMEKYGARIWLTRIMVSWGLISAAMDFVQNAEMFYVLRFLLGAAISVADGQTEKLVTIIEQKKRGASDDEVAENLAAVRREVASAVFNTHGLSIADLVLVPPGSIPITTSGKVRRASCVEHYRHGQFDRLDS